MTENEYALLPPRQQIALDKINDLENYNFQTLQSKTANFQQESITPPSPSISTGLKLGECVWERERQSLMSSPDFQR